MYYRAKTYRYFFQFPRAYRYACWLYCFLVVFGLLFSAIKGEVYVKKILGTETHQVSNKETWDAGTLTNLDTEDTPGDLKMAPSGTWTARSWKTPPNSLTLGMAMASDGTDIYVLRGNGDQAFWKYSPTANNWTVLSNAPIGVYNGSYLEMASADTIYAIFGNYTKKFYKYTISTNTWTALDDLPDTCGSGTGMAWANNKLYVLRSLATQDFWQYDPNAAPGLDKWSTLSGPPATVSNASDLVYDGTYLYTLRGTSTTTWYRYHVVDKLWEAMTTAYPTAINEATFMDYHDGILYVQHGVNTTNLYACTISAKTCSGGWQTITTPAATRYAGVLYHAGDGYLYSFRGAASYDFWKFDIGAGEFVGPTDFPQAISTGGDVIWDGDANGYVYALKGGNPNSPVNSGFYRYDIDNNSWEARNVTNLPTLSYDTKTVKAGDYIYLFQGNSTAFWRFNMAANDPWEALTAAPASIRNGGSLAYPGSGDLIYAAQGNGTGSIYAYHIGNNRWTDFDPADLPSGVTINTGGRLISDGTYIYAVLGLGNNNFYRYTYDVGGGSWDNLGRLPFVPYTGTDITYYNGKIYALAGWYKNKLYEYTIGGSWRQLPNIQTQYLYDIGPYSGASLEYMGSNTLMMTRGNSYASVLNYTIDATKYLASGTYISPAIDVTYAESWNSLNTSQSTPDDSSITMQVRTSLDAASWSDWQTLSGATPAGRYIQVKATLTASTDQLQTPVLNSYTISYETDDTAPTNPSSVTASSQEVGGVEITSGISYDYRHPYFVWPAAESPGGASDSGSGVAGYYVYFGPNAGADPAADGFYQTTTHYVANTALSTGNNYLILKTKNRAGIVSDATNPPLFTYVYSGVSPPETLSKSTTADFEAGVLTDVSSRDISGGATDKLKLATQDGFWQQQRLSITPGTTGYGASMVYKASTGKYYIARGRALTDFWSYEPATDTWLTLNSTGLTAINYGGGIVNGPGNYIYAAAGGTSNKFYRYDITDDASGWDDAAAEDAPTGCFNYGGYQIFDGNRYIYSFKGGDDAFLRFDPLTGPSGQWDSRANADFGYPAQTGNNNSYNGAALAYDGSNTIYAIQGNLYPGGFAKYTITANSWTALTAHLPIAPTAGADLSFDATTGYLYYIPGGGLPNMFKYNPTAEEWSEVASAPYGITYGSVIRVLGDTIYSFRGNSTGFYKYSISKDTWYTPSFNLFGPNWFGTSVFGTYYGAQIVKGDGNNFYATRGYYDNIFIKYNSTSGSATKMANLPQGAYSGTALVYDEDDNAIYATCGTVETAFFKYDVATDTWSELSSDPPPEAPNYGASMAYDGSRYIYYARGGNSNQWFKFDKLAGAGSRWYATSLPTTNLAGQGYGSRFVLKDGYIYTLRGQNVNPNPFYRFDLSQIAGDPPYAGSWEVLDPLNVAVYNDGFLVDGQDGYLYASPAGNHATYGNDWWRYNLATPGWEQVADVPANVYQGGDGASNGLNKIFAFAGTGTGSWSDGLYTYVVKTEDSSFKEEGSYVSEAIDLTSQAGKAAYDWANISVTYSEASNATLSVYTQSSNDNLSWSEWAISAQEKLRGEVHEYSINAPTARYLKVKFVFCSGDNILSPTVEQYTVNYYKDLQPPENPTALSQAKSQKSGGSDISSDNWYKYANPYFTWPDKETPGGATDGSGGSGVAGYYLYLGDDSGATPSTTRGIATQIGETGLHYQTNLDFEVGVDSSALVHGTTYYLRLQTKDNAGNVQGAVWDIFTYKYDSQSPTNPSSLNVNPVGYTNIDNYVFTISGDASDPDSGLWKYQYRTGGDAEDAWTDFDPVLSTTVTIPNGSHPEGKYQEGANQFYLRVVDNAQNASSPKTVQYYFGNAAPSPPQDLKADPPTSSTNSFTFSWDPPAAYIGDVNKITYYYSVNAVPTQYNTGSTSQLAVGPSAFATQKGSNIFYVVAKDEAGNIDYGQYAQVTFSANTSAPGAPTDVQASDISNKEGNEYRLVVSWLAPTIPDPNNFNGYDVYSSTKPNSGFEKIANTTGTAYVDVDLEKDSTHYYYVVSVDKTGNSSAHSNIASAVATGRYTQPPDIVTNPTATAKATSAIITWSTSREANSVVEYGKTEELGSVTGNPQSLFVTAHEVNLTNLQAGTTYYFKVVFTDPDGNQGSSSIGSFVTAPAPQIAGLIVEDITLTSMLITWDSNVPSYGEIHYGEGGAISSVEKEDPYYITHHVVKLKDLKNDTAYGFQVKARDQEGNNFNSDLYSASTLALPKVSEVKVENKTEVESPTMQISYKTNVETTTLVRYIPDGQPVKEHHASDYNQEHSLELTDLMPAYPYTLEVTGRDRYGNEAEPQIHKITTLSDTMPPKVTKRVERKKVVGEGESAEAQLTVKLTTNEPSTMLVEACKGVGCQEFNIKSNEDPLNIDHTVVVKLGDSTTPYSYRIRLKDAAGNESITDVKTLVVARANKSALEYILAIFSRSFGWMKELF